MGQVENKCAKLLVVVTVILVGLGIAMLLKSQRLFSPSLPIEWIRLVALLLAVFAFVCAWGHILLALKIEAFPQSDKGGKAVMSPEKHSVQSSKLKAEKMAASEYLSEAIYEKNRNLRLAGEELTMGAWFIGITVAISLGMALLA